VGERLEVDGLRWDPAPAGRHSGRPGVAALSGRALQPAAPLALAVPAEKEASASRAARRAGHPRRIAAGVARPPSRPAGGGRSRPQPAERSPILATSRPCAAS